MNFRVLSVPSVLVLTMISLAGCDDPSKGKVKAQTGEAVAQTSAAATPANATTYAFDQSGSKVDWAAAKVSMKHDGGFRTFSGTIKAAPSAPEKAAVDVTIDTASVYSDNPKLTKHLTSGDFFDVAKFPKATFTSTKIEAGGGGKAGATHTITGNLSLHGVTKSVTFPATVAIDADKADVDAEFVLDRKDFGLVYPGMPDDLINDNVTMKLHVRAKKTPAT